MASTPEYSELDKSIGRCGTDWHASNTKRALGQSLSRKAVTLGTGRIVPRTLDRWDRDIILVVGERWRLRESRL